jgi:glutamate-ammonia-ligase adenylyltransferase
VGERHFEDTLDLLRRWSGERRFQVGVQLLRRALDGEGAGAALSDIAETALASLVPAVEAEFAGRHGRVPGGSFAVIGMGRLGSREMTLGSDLDLIMIYDAPRGIDISDGAHALPVAAYYARLSQRLIGAITAPTAEGRLYAVDMRLRPSGEAGPIASHFAGFARYQRESAWTWEHMALTRARPIAGDAALQSRISEAITGVLRAPRDPGKLISDVADMRRRISAENPHPSAWDLRNRRGGLIDLEFIVQCLMLRHAAAHPDVLRRGTADALVALDEAGLLSPRAQEELGEAALLFRNVQAVLALLGNGSPPRSLSAPDGVTLARCVGAVDSDRLDANISAAAARVRSWYDRLIEEPARRAAEEPGDSMR